MKPKSNHVFRTTFLVIVGLITLWWGLSWAAVGSLSGVSLFAVSLGATWMVCMAASWIAYGFTDETFIPTKEITEKIQTIYRQQNPQTPKFPWPKRVLDIVISLLGIVVSFPLWLLIIFLIWLQDPGPILFIKHCSGYRGKPFRLYKFRTMKINAEIETGPIVSAGADQRVRGISKVLRKTALDELPQLINILVGEMSFVGPRPLRSVVEIENIQHIPGYTQRYNSLPGLAGLAQICGDNLLPSRDKLRYERIYTKHAGVLFDIKLIIIACLVVFYLRWKKDWDGRIPRAWIRYGS